MAVAITLRELIIYPTCKLLPRAGRVLSNGFGQSQTKVSCPTNVLQGSCACTVRRQSVQMPAAATAQKACLQLARNPPTIPVRMSPVLPPVAMPDCPVIFTQASPPGCTTNVRCPLAHTTKSCSRANLAPLLSDLSARPQEAAGRRAISPGGGVLTNGFGLCIQFALSGAGDALSIASQKHGSFKFCNQTTHQIRVCDSRNPCPTREARSSLRHSSIRFSLYRIVPRRCSASGFGHQLGIKSFPRFRYCLRRGTVERPCPRAATLPSPPLPLPQPFQVDPPTHQQRVHSCLYSTPPDATYSCRNTRAVNP